MDWDEHNLNQQAYERIKDELARMYPFGQFIAFVHGMVVADAATLEELHGKLENIERNPDRRFVIQAGVEYPEYEIIREVYDP